MGRHRHLVNVRADGIAVVLGPLLRDVRIVAAALVDVDSGMVLDAWSAADAATGPPDLELIGAQHAEIVRCALHLLRTWPDAGGATGSCEVVLGADGGVRHLLRTVPDPLGDRLALAVVVDGPQRVLDRVRKRLETVSVDALTAGPSMTRRPSGGGWSFDTPGPDVPAQPEPAAGLLSPGAGPATARPAPDRGVPPARGGRPGTGPGVPSPRDPYPVGPYGVGSYQAGPNQAGPNQAGSDPVGAAPGQPPYRHDGPAVGRSATGEPAASGPGSVGPGWVGPGSVGAVPAMSGLVRPVPLGAAPPLAPAGTAPAQAGTRNDTGRDTLGGTASEDGVAAEAGAGIASVVIAAEPAARAARRPVLFSVAGGDTSPRPSGRQVPAAAQGATEPVDPQAAEPAAAPAVRPATDPPAPAPRPASPPSASRPPSPPAALPAPAQPRPPHA